MFQDVKVGEESSFNYHEIYEKEKSTAMKLIDDYKDALNDHDRFHFKKDLLKDRLYQRYMFQENGLFLTCLLSLGARIQMTPVSQPDEVIELEPPLDEVSELKRRFTFMAYVPRQVAWRITSRWKPGNPKPTDFLFLFTLCCIIT